jgi:hypothetical protein
VSVDLGGRRIIKKKTTYHKRKNPKKRVNPKTMGQNQNFALVKSQLSYTILMSFFISIDISVHPTHFSQKN